MFQQVHIFGRLYVYKFIEVVMVVIVW